jgi:hypothetical protein
MAAQSPSYTLPTTLHPSDPQSTHRSWRTRLQFPSSHSNPPVNEIDNTNLDQQRTTTSTGSNHVPKWYKIRLFHGMINDLRRRGPFYWSDWTDAWDYRVIPATVYMYFANILPALAFSLDM